ncbi:serine/threonine protein kinase [Kitasatospora acidiphila]|uniref:non-specific serine/threonine protein kinase n=1 Tax=Kitasatospora acidiphila TaxID=2567942 RepID=A0A540WAT6_9ACTN|nr:serine/threonine-protein kinase [Kitasatospora acidiphila]TQF06072.1 serine/threonine protein kinase [Kitasatospora acidiphila]
MRVLADRYELVRFIGRGGMGEVWEGRDQVIGRPVAVKLLPHQVSPGSVDLFFREARTAGGLNHRSVVTVHDIGQDPADGTLFLVMEFVAGSNLAARLRADGPPPVPTAVDWADQTAAALGAAHQANVVHRDLKPANLMLTAGGEVKVLDFGIARYMEGTNQSSQVMGTLAYMAPERFDGAPGDARSDLYALGCVLHEFLTGAPPFQETGPLAMMNAHLRRTPVAPSALRPDVPAALDALVMRLLAKDPAARPSSTYEVQAVLRAVAAGAAPTATAAPTPAPIAAPTPTAAATAGPPPTPVVMASIVHDAPQFPPPGFPAATVPLGAAAGAAPTHRGPRITVAAAGVLSLVSLLALPLWDQWRESEAITGLDLLLGKTSWEAAPWIWPPTVAMALLTVLALATAWPRRSRLGTGVCWAAIPIGLLATASAVVLGMLAVDLGTSACGAAHASSPMRAALARRCLSSTGLDFGFYVGAAATLLVACGGLWALVQQLRHRRRTA